MSIRDELAGGTVTGNPCKLCAFLSPLTESSRAQWVAELARPVNEVGNMSVVRALHRRNFSITERSVRRHRENHARP